MQLVVGAIIVDSLAHPTRVLAARRLQPAGRWEFPGGKVEAGEEPEAALRRELAEELAVGVQIGAELRAGDAAAWPLDSELELRLWFCAVAEGEPAPGDSHDEVRWLPIRDLDQVWWLDGDGAAVRALMGQAT